MTESRSGEAMPGVDVGGINACRRAGGNFLR